jgi:hypothetical protein
MTKKILLMLFAVVLALAAVKQAFAEEQTKEQVQTKAEALPVPQQCFTSGANKTFLKVCITNNGNISWFESPAGFVHIQSREGYAVCSGGIPGNGAIVNGFDANLAADGLGGPTVSQPNGAGKFPLIITRQSLDGMFQLKQTFTLNTVERGVDVKMDLKNTSASEVDHVFASRYFDGDIDNKSTNVYDRVADSVWGRDPAFLTRGLMLTVAPSTLDYWNTSATAYPLWDPFGSGPQYARGCDWDNSYTPATGDYVGILQMSMGTLKAGQTKSATLHYRRF